MFKKLFNIGMSAKLSNLIEKLIKDRFSYSSQVFCSLSSRPNNKYSYSANIITSNSLLGGINGSYTFYESKNYNNFREALISLTEDVSRTSKELPKMIFIRTLTLCSKKDADDYILNYKILKNREVWLENTMNCSFSKQKFNIQEQLRAIIHI